MDGGTIRPEVPSVCVIGAGISGLTATKILTDYRIPVECFELSDRIGGNWAFGNPNGRSSAYRSLHIDSSKTRVSFADYPVPASAPEFMHHSDVKAYLDDYADAFGLGSHIRFNNGVEHAERLAGGSWEITLQDGTRRRFDVLVVGNGHHWDPRYPQFPGTFDGQTIHSHHYIDLDHPLRLCDKRILVVGLGNSAADIASELSQRSYGNRIVVSTRSSGWILPKYAFGRPLDRLVRTIPQIPLRWQRAAVRPLAQLLSGRPERLGLPQPTHRLLDAHPTFSNELPLRLASGDVFVKPDVTLLDGSRVHFEDGAVEDFDVIIYATGYNISFPFFNPDFLPVSDNRIGLYKRMFIPGVDDVVFIGFTQALPSLFPYVEVQSRLLGAYLAGRYRLPAVAQMVQAIAADDARFTGNYSNRARHTQEGDYYVYAHEMFSRELPEGLRRVERLGPPRLARTSRDYTKAPDAA